MTTTTTKAVRRQPRFSLDEIACTNLSELRRRTGRRIAKATLLWRRSWNRQRSPARRNDGVNWLFQKLADAIGFPAAFGNTRPSVPAAENRSK